MIAAAVLLLAAGGANADCARLLDGATAPVERSLAFFELQPEYSAAALSSARELLARAHDETSAAEQTHAIHRTRRRQLKLPLSRAS